MWGLVALSRWCGLMAPPQKKKKQKRWVQLLHRTGTGWWFVWGMDPQPPCFTLVKHYNSPGQGVSLKLTFRRRQNRECPQSTARPPANWLLPFSRFAWTGWLPFHHKNKSCFVLWGGGAVRFLSFVLLLVIVFVSISSRS